MGTMTLSVPDVLKEEMDAVNWVNWSSVARKAFVETLQDIKEMEAVKKAREISEIAEDDNREVRDSVVEEVVRIGEAESGKLDSGERKPMTLDEFNKWCKGRPF